MAHLMVGRWVVPRAGHWEPQKVPRKVVQRAVQLVVHWADHWEQLMGC